MHMDLWALTGRFEDRGTHCGSAYCNSKLLMAWVAPPDRPGFGLKPDGKALEEVRVL